MQELNWNIFRVRFSGRESQAFESLCYLLFCREFGRNTGIFRYKNQTGIETEPILVDGQLLGFQAKFFDYTINKQDLTESIRKAKGKNPELKKIQIYLNQEFSESTKVDKKDATTKPAIEEFAHSIGLEVLPYLLKRSLILNDFPNWKPRFEREAPQRRCDMEVGN